MRSQGAFDFGPSQTGPYGPGGPPPKDPRGRKPKAPRIVITRMCDGGRLEYVAEGLSEERNEQGRRVPHWTPRLSQARTFSSVEAARGFAEMRIPGKFTVETV